MNELDLMVRAPAAPSAVVPMDYAEKAMGSLMQLHSELMEEKERRVDLYRRLMEKEQAVAELRMYVKLLEEKVAQRPAPAQGAPVLRVVPRPPPPPARVRASRPPAPPPPPAPRAEAVAAPYRPAARRFAASDGWKAW
ncbi:MAG TPA: hypothetical protein VH208_05745 [Myxococcaceae bacterium]|nr:hypothetical protein [Myxococcaceae bacterium]